MKFLLINEYAFIKITSAWSSAIFVKCVLIIDWALATCCFNSFISAIDSFDSSFATPLEIGKIGSWFSFDFPENQTQFRLLIISYVHPRATADGDSVFFEKNTILFRNWNQNSWRRVQKLKCVKGKAGTWDLFKIFLNSRITIQEHAWKSVWNKYFTNGYSIQLNVVTNTIITIPVIIIKKAQQFY